MSKLISAPRIVPVCLIMIASLFLSGVSGAAPGEISTYAGGGNGEGFPALEGVLIAPAGITDDGEGSVYIADPRGNRIRRVSADGIMNTVAGTGFSAFGGDGGPATAASLSLPNDVAVGVDGSVYIADTYNDRIRRIDASGTIETVVGGGVLRPSMSDGMPGRAVDLWYPAAVESLPDGAIAFTNSGFNAVMLLDTQGKIRVLAGTGTRGFSGDGGSATSARLDNPTGLASAGDGTLYVADTGNDRIRKIDPSGMITTIAGGGTEFADDIPATSAVLRDPTALDLHGNRLLVADTNHNRIRSIDSDGYIRLVAGSGGSCRDVRDGAPAEEVCLPGPRGVRALADGSILASAYYAYRVIGISDGVARHFAGNGSTTFVGDGHEARRAVIMEPRGLDIAPDGSLLIAETVRGRVRRIGSDGIITTLAGTTPGFSGDGGPATAAQLRDPYGVTAGPDGSVYVADTSNRRIRKVDSTGIITTVAGGGSCRDGDGGPATAAFLNSPKDVAFDPAGNLYIAEVSRIRKIDPNGTISTFAGSRDSGFNGDGRQALDTWFSRPHSLDFNSLGELIIADTFNSRIRKVALDGTVTTLAGGGVTYAADVPSAGTPASMSSLRQPMSLRVDDLDRIFIADTNSHQVKMIDDSGAIWTVAGGPVYDDTYGDGRDARTAHLHYPAGLAIDASGNLFVSDSDHTHWLIRRVEGPT